MCIAFLYVNGSSQSSLICVKFCYTASLRRDALLCITLMNVHKHSLYVQEDVMRNATLSKNGETQRILSHTQVSRMR